MGEPALVAEGTASMVSIVGHKVVIQEKGVKSILKRGFTLYRDPRSAASVFGGPSKKVIAAALAENKELAKVIVGAVKGAGGVSRPGAAEPDSAPVSEAAGAPGDRGASGAAGASRDGAAPGATDETGDDGGVARALADAFKNNRQAVVQALRDNDALLKAWLRDHKDLAGIVLKGDVHLFVADITSAALARSRDGRRALVLTADGEQIAVPYDEANEADFHRLCTVLSGGTVVDVTAPTPGSPDASAAPPAAAGTKTCPMCAEEIKAAAVLCRFCGHRFDQS